MRIGVKASGKPYATPTFFVSFVSRNNHQADGLGLSPALEDS